MKVVRIEDLPLNDLWLNELMKLFRQYILKEIRCARGLGYLLLFTNLDKVQGKVKNDFKRIERIG